MSFPSSEVPLSKCPVCGYLMNQATPAERGDAVPKPGDLSVCLNCAALLQFDDDLMLKPGDNKLLDQMSFKQRKLIRLGREFILNRGRIDRDSKR